jgi:uncharacterized protein (DUF1697 family)
MTGRKLVGNRESPRASAWVALLRGVNVGGRHLLPMETLARFFEQAGCSEVRTVIQSGNVLFRATATVARAAPALVEARIEKECGFRAPIVLRSAAEVAAVLAGNPFLAEGEEELLQVVFLAKKPAPAAVAKLDPGHSLGDRFVVRGREVYLLLPRGVSGTRFTVDYLDRTLGTTGTWRNWRSVKRMGEG